MDALTYNRGRRYSVPVITQIQRFVGVDQPNGRWTDETVAGVREFQADQGLVVDGRVGPATLALLQELDARADVRIDDDELALAQATARAKALALEQLRTWCGDTFELVDYRDLTKWSRKHRYDTSYGWPRDKSRAHPPLGGVRRQWRDITTIMLHTTAVPGMTGKRGIGIPCHLFLPKHDAIVLCHELELLLYHGHAGNDFSVGLEISGRADWDNPTQIDRAKALLRYFQAVRRSEVGDDAPCYVMTHRQSHASRGNDPGKRIWQDVGEWAIDELGFELGGVVGSGRSIDKWRPKRPV